MSKKKSMGHNPLAYSLLRHSSFDFIQTQNFENKSESETIAPKKNSNKISVCYYLEESLVHRIKTLATKKDVSYSSVVNRILKNSLTES